MAKHRRNISISKELELKMLQESQRLEVDFSALIGICFKHYEERDNEITISNLFKKKKRKKS